MNKKLSKNSIYLKYNFCNNIHYRSKACGQYFYFFLKKLIFIQQGFVKLIEKIDIVRKHLYFEKNAVLFNFLLINEPQKVSQVPK